MSDSNGKKIWLVVCERGNLVEWWTAVEAENAQAAALGAIGKSTKRFIDEKVTATAICRDALLLLAARMASERSLPGTESDLADWSHRIGVAP